MRKMNDDEFRNAQGMYEKFKTDKIDMNTIKEAEEKANYLGELADDFILMLQMVKDSIFGDFKLTTAELATFIGAILYVVSPVDAIPDFIPFVGYIDDVAVLGLVLNKGTSALNRYKTSKFLR